MRLIFISLTLLAFNFCGAQTSAFESSKSTIDRNDNIARYRVDYQLKEYSFTEGDSTILNQLNLASFESLRHDVNDVEIQDEATGLIIILYSRKEMLERKGIYRIEY